MSVPVQDPINQIVIVGGETTAPWTWNLQQENEIIVQKNIATTGLTVLLTLGVDYTVNPAGLGMDAGGTINFEAPQLPAQVGDVWTMSRDTTLNRSDNFATSGDFFAQTINDQLDKLTRIDQDNDRDSESAIRKDPGVGDVLNPLIPQMVDRRALLFQDNGGGNFEMIMSEFDPDITAADAADSAAAALASEQAAAISETNAGISETNAANSETAAAQSASDASDSADDAAASAASIDLSSPAPIGDVTPNTIKATTFEGDAGGTTINEFSTDGTLAGDSDDAVPTEKAVKAFVDNNAFTAATQAQQEAGTDITVGVTPGRQQFHQSAVKAWVSFNGTGVVAIFESYNVTSLTDRAVGEYTINIATDFSGAGYASAGMSQGSSGNAGYISRDINVTTTVGAFPIETKNQAGILQDNLYNSVVLLGDQ